MLLNDWHSVERGQAALDAIIPIEIAAEPIEPKKERKERKERKELETPFEDIEPWSEEINACELLHEIAKTIRRFVCCNPETANAAALWVTMTWFIDVIEVAPIGAVTAPEKRCGKSILLTALSLMSRRPMTASNITPSALFRSIDAWSPTLFIDEADAFMRDNEELRGLINCGHTRPSAYIVRTVGTEHTPKMFNTWGAKAISGIGHLADTIMDRSVVFELRRKLPTESVERLRHAGPELWKTLSSKLARFAEDRSEDVRRQRPNLPDELNDRAQDNWEPLLQIADVAGGDWPKVARLAAIALSGDNEQSKTIGVELLGDIHEAFETKNVDRISSAELVEILIADEEKPWAGYNRGFPIKPAQVAKRLKEYRICSNTIRIGITTKKGYLKEQFSDAFNRYLFSDAVKPDLPVTPSQASIDAGLGVTSVLPVTSIGVTRNTEVTRKASIGAGCDGVTANDRNTAKTVEVKL